MKIEANSWRILRVLGFRKLWNQNAHSFTSKKIWYFIYNIYEQRHPYNGKQNFSLNCKLIDTVHTKYFDIERPCHPLKNDNKPIVWNFTFIPIP